MELFKVGKFVLLHICHLNSIPGDGFYTGDDATTLSNCSRLCSVAAVKTAEAVFRESEFLCLAEPARYLFGWNIFSWLLF